MIYENIIRELYNDADDCLAKVRQVSGALGIEPDWLMQVMYSESRLDTQAVNKITNATGLIQFMPNTAKELNTTVATLYTMTFIQQMDYVYKYLLRYKKYLTSYANLYMAVFYPAGLTMREASILPDKVYFANKGLDINKDGQLTLAEVKQWFINRIPDELKEFVLKKKLQSDSESYC
jgi:hypothetical protein